MKISPFRLSWFPLFFIFYELTGNLSNDMYLPAFLQITQDLSTEISHVQLSITTWLLGLSCSQIFLGPFCDRFGRRPVLLWGGIIFLISTLGCALTGALWLLIVARLFQGFGVGSIMIAGYASIHTLYDDRRATLILAWTSSAAVVAPMLGPLLGSWVLLFGDWRSIFTIIFLGALIGLTCTSLLMPESLEPEKKISLNLLSIGKIYGRIITTWGFLARTLSFGLLYSGMILWITTSPFIVMKVYHYTPSQFGYLQIPVFAGFIVGAQCVRFLLHLLTREKLILLGIIISTFGALLMVVSSLLMTQTLFVILGSMVVYSLGFGFAAAPLTRESLIATDQLILCGLFYFFPIFKFDSTDNLDYQLRPLQSPPIFLSLCCQLEYHRQSRSPRTTSFCLSRAMSNCSKS